MKFQMFFETKNVENGTKFMQKNPYKCSKDLLKNFPNNSTAQKVPKIQSSCNKQQHLFLISFLPIITKIPLILASLSIAVH